MSYFRTRHFLASGLWAVGKASRMMVMAAEGQGLAVKPDEDRGVGARTSYSHQASSACFEYLKNLGDSFTAALRIVDPSFPHPVEEEESGDANNSEFDFIVVGNGSAGRSATNELLRTCPHCSIAVIDPHNDRATADAVTTRIRSVRAWATFLDPGNRVVSARDVEGTWSLRYRYGALLATGAHGAPIPSYLVDEGARERVFELRPTTVPSKSAVPQVYLSKEGVKKRIASEAADGNTIGVLGSGWDALDVASRCRRQRSGQVHLYFGESSPLKSVLPIYLGVAVAKRLRIQNIEVHDRTLVRYVSLAGPTGDDQSPLHLHSVKSFDYMDTSVDRLDFLVVAPETGGNRGNAVLPSSDIPAHLDSKENRRFWYQPWSHLTVKSTKEPQYIACYKDDGRIVVNQELCASRGVYAAGSVAKFPNPLSGRAHPSGYGSECSAEAGRVAAWNMSNEYFLSRRERNECNMVKNPIHIFRSDFLTFASDQPSALACIGVEALCVGLCDAERFSTCGIWWTNQASQRRQISRDASGESLTRVESIRGSRRPVYGVGVVYYVDKMGKIQGVMTWGIPFTIGEDRMLNPRLSLLMNEMIIGPNEFKSSLNLFVNTDVKDFLVRKSRQLVAAASESLAGGRRTLTGDALMDAATKKPLFRCTDSVFSEFGIAGSRRIIAASHWVSDEALFHSSARPSFDALENREADSDNRLEWNYWLHREMHFDENADLARPSREDHLWLRKGDESRNVSARDNKISAYYAAIYST